MLSFVRGDMFALPADIRVNTVNCVGVMGAGVALAFKTRYPEMFRAYKKACDAGEIRPGEVHVWKTLTEWIINFPTKRHWRDKSRYEDIAAGLTALHQYLSKQGPVRVALPALGCGHGGLDWARVSKMIRNALEDLEAHIFVFEPSDSVAAGDRITEAKRATSGAAEIVADQLGMGRSEHPLRLRDWGVERAFVLGHLELLQRAWLAVIPSVKPDVREEAAATACVDAIARSGITTAFRYGGRLPRLLCDAALARDANVILWAAEGIDHVKPSRGLQTELERGRVAIVSVATPADRWTAANAKRTSLLLTELAQAVLITDPCPQWLLTAAGHGEALHWPKIFYVLYGNSDPAAVGRLKHEGAQAVGRDAHTGLPRTAPVLAALGIPT